MNLMQSEAKEGFIGERSKPEKKPTFPFPQRDREPVGPATGPSDTRVANEGGPNCMGICKVENCIGSSCTEEFHAWTGSAGASVVGGGCGGGVEGVPNQGVFRSTDQVCAICSTLTQDYCCPDTEVPVCP